MTSGLDDLRSRYDLLREQVERGELTVEQATMTLGSITVTDAAGYEWSIDPYGALLRRLPGGVPVPADESLFTTASGSSDFGNLLVPPVLEPLGVSSDSGFDAVSIPADEDARRPKRQRRVRKDRAPRERRDFRLPNPSALLSKLRRYRGFIIVALCVALVVALLVTRPQTTTVTDPALVDPTATTVATDVPAGSDTTAPPAPDTTAAPALPADPSQITVEHADRLFTALASADRQLVAAVAPSGADEFQLVLRAAQYAGYRTVGLSFDIDRREDGSFLVTLKDAKKTITRFVAVLTLDTRGVVLAAWPEPAR
jgi:hypothetical protein